MIMNGNQFDEAEHDLDLLTSTNSNGNVNKSLSTRYKTQLIETDKTEYYIKQKEHTLGITERCNDLLCESTAKQEKHSENTENCEKASEVYECMTQSCRGNKEHDKNVITADLQYTFEVQSGYNHLSISDFNKELVANAD